jgi:TET-Associated Glycosyltransferase
MSQVNEIRYPLYIPSKGRADRCLTAQLCRREGIPHWIVVEPPQVDAYAATCGHEHLLVLPFCGTGSSVAARNWIKDHAIATGAKRHWQLDDNIRSARRIYRGQRCHCSLRVALRVIEDFVDRYTNIAIAGPNYSFFVRGWWMPPLYRNGRVYSCSLILNAIPHRWRPDYNEDTDICLQVLADGWCTALVNAFTIDKMQTMKMPGGNTTTLYRGDGRLAMARSLERDWPGVASVSRRFQRPQHRVDFTKFDTPFIRRDDIDWSTLATPNEYGLALMPAGPPIDVCG